MSERVKFTIDGIEVEADQGEWLIKAAQEHGTYIPRFCYHERMEPVGMCRMCLVEVEGARGFPPACTTPVKEGMVVRTETPAVKKVQDGVLEFLLINHPLDCPVCDRGGECPLQDQTLAFGPGESRFVEEKRHFEKPIPISELVMLDRERCIQCARCTRFAEEVAGDPLIDFVDRGEQMQVLTFPDEPFRSYFSGNTVQICPVGALTASSYRFRARPWDLETAETSCQTCSVGCRGALQSSSNQLVRLLGVDSEPVNQGWLCDKGRYGFEWVKSPERITEPRVRKAAELIEASWPEALTAAADGLRSVVEEHGPGAVAMLGGARVANEGAYAFARLAKGVLRTDNVDAQLGDGLPAELVLGTPRALISDCDRAAGILLLGPDLKEELPVLYLRVRRAAEDLGVPLIEITARDTGLTRYADAIVRAVPGEERSAVDRVLRALEGDAPVTGSDGRPIALSQAAEAIRGRDGGLLVLLGRPSVATAPAVIEDAVARLVGRPATRFLSTLRRANVHGALDLGLAPGFLPGRVTLDAGRGRVEPVWGSLPESRGLDAEGILRATVAGDVKALILLGVDPLTDFPDAKLAADAVYAADFIVAVGAFADDASGHADVLLPATVWGETDGTSSNLESRVQRLNQKVAPAGASMADWRIAAELGARLGFEFGFETVQDVQDEIASVAPAFEGADSSLIARARDGLAVPLAAHREEPVLGTAPAVVNELSWEPIPSGSDATEPGAPSDREPGTPASATGSPPEALLPVGQSEGDHEQSSELFAYAEHLHTIHVPSRDAYALRLVVGRKLYDEGRVTTGTRVLAQLIAPTTLLVHPRDRDRIGVADGADVRVRGARASIVVPITGDAATPEGVAFLALAQGGRDDRGAGELIDADRVVTDVRVETVS